MSKASGHTWARIAGGAVVVLLLAATYVLGIRSYDAPADAAAEPVCGHETDARVQDAFSTLPRAAEYAGPAAGSHGFCLVVLRGSGADDVVAYRSALPEAGWKLQPSGEAEVVARRGGLQVRVHLVQVNRDRAAAQLELGLVDPS